MAAYAIIDNEITDQAQFDEYASAIIAVVERCGGKYLVRGGPTEIVSGNRTPHRVVVIEFENIERARAYANDPESRRLGEIRDRSSISTTIIVEGV